MVLLLSVNTDLIMGKNDFLYKITVEKGVFGFVLFFCGCCFWFWFWRVFSLGECFINFCSLCTVFDSNYGKKEKKSSLNKQVEIAIHTSDKALHSQNTFPFWIIFVSFLSSRPVCRGAVRFPETKRGR